MTRKKSYTENLIFKKYVFFVRWNKLLLSKGTVVLCRNYNATLHFKLTAFHLTKMGVTHITVAYLLQNSLTTEQNRVHLTRSNCFSLVWHSRKIANNFTLQWSLADLSLTKDFEGRQVTSWFLYTGLREQNQTTTCVYALSHV